MDGLLLLTARPDGSLTVRHASIHMKSNPPQFDHGAGHNLIVWEDAEFQLKSRGVDPAVWRRLPKAEPLKQEMNSGHFVTYHDVRALRSS